MKIHKDGKACMEHGSPESQVPICPKMKGKLDFPFLQIFKLRVLRANIAPPNRTPLPRAVGFLEKMKPISPPLKTRPPVE